MLEHFLFSPMVMPMETARIFLALLGMAVASYFDVFNNRNVPEYFLYAFLGVAFLFNIVFFDYDVFVYGAVLAAILSAIGFVLYKMGQIGGADVFVVAALVLLLPVHPSYLNVPFNYPLIFSVLIFGGAAFALYSLYYFGTIIAKAKKKAKPQYAYLLLFLLYAVFAYMFFSAPFFSLAYFAIASVLLLSSILFLVYRKTIVEATMSQVLVKQLEPEDVLVKEKMEGPLKRMDVGPVLSREDIAKLGKAGVRHVWIYSELPPFLPFLFVGLLLSLVAGGQLFLIF